MLVVAVRTNKSSRTKSPCHRIKGDDGTNASRAISNVHNCSKTPFSSPSGEAACATALVPQKRVIAFFSFYGPEKTAQRRGERSDVRACVCLLPCSSVVVAGAFLSISTSPSAKKLLSPTHSSANGLLLVAVRRVAVKRTSLEARRRLHPRERLATSVDLLRRQRHSCGLRVAVRVVI